MSTDNESDLSDIKRVAALLKKLKVQTVELDAQKQLLDKQQALIAAALPHSPITPSASAASLSDASGTYVDLLAYQVMNQIAEDLVTEIQRTVQQEPSVKILIVDTQKMAPDDLTTEQIEAQFGFFEQQFAQQLTQSRTILESIRAGLAQTQASGSRSVALVGSVIPAATAILSQIATLTSLFQVEYVFKGHATTLAQEAVMAAVGGKLAAGKLENNTAVTAHIRDLNLPEDTTIAVRMRTLITTSHESELERKNLQTVVASITPGDTVLDDLITKAKTLLAESEALGAMFADYLITLNASATEAEPSLLAKAVHSASIKNKGYTHLLYVKPALAGGEMVTQKRLFRGTSISYLAGCAISYVFSTASGQVVSAGLKVSKGKFTGEER